MHSLGVYAPYQELVTENIIQIDNLEKTEDNTITYTIQIDKNTTSYVTQTKMENGDVQLNFQEGDLYNELVVTNDNKLFLDGNEITVHVSDEKKISVDDEVVTPFLGAVEYSWSPLGGTATGYNNTSGAEKYDINLTKNII